jgi:hypothetical protein
VWNDRRAVRGLPAAVPASADRELVVKLSYLFARCDGAPFLPPHVPSLVRAFASGGPRVLGIDVGTAPKSLA